MLYSHEIQNIILKNSYIIPSELYLKICDTSSQISSIKFDPFDDSHQISTNDGYGWKLKIVK